MFHIHPLTVEDIQTQESREKCEIFQNYMFVAFHITIFEILLFHQLIKSDLLGL